MTTKINFSDCFCGSVQVPSSWRGRGKDSVRTAECQTPEEFFQFKDAETQSGRGTQVHQSQVNSKEGNQSLIDYLENNLKFKSRKEWQKFIENGCVAIESEEADFKTCTDPAIKVFKDTIVECVDARRDAEVQTERDDSKTDDSMLFSRELSVFLTKVLPDMEAELESNAGSQAFNNYQLTQGDTSQDIALWDLLTVDLEKNKVVFPDWSSARHSRGRISRCVLTRNKERIYDIDFDDEFKLSGVREEHIRLLDQKQAKGAKARGQQEKKPNLRLQEGIRVHAKVNFKGSEVKYLPGRITKCNRNGSYDVECEGSRVESGMPIEDLIVGLEEGQLVEARRPTKVELQCTGLSWNATGNTIAASYGRNDMSGWCEYPGAVCLWPVFARGFRNDEPAFVLDHTSCLMCVACHPVNPAIVAAGSFNGEILVWDLTSPEQPIGASKTSEYSHQEPVMDIQWIQGGGGNGSGNSNNKDDWLLNSAGADGKVLFWSASNDYSSPVRGFTLIAHGRAGKSSRR
jgi:WD40 repeat protein